MPIEALAEFTFEQCFNYFNYQGAVKLPSAMQSAEKLSKMTAHILDEKKENTLRNQPDYLWSRKKRSQQKQGMIMHMVCHKYVNVSFTPKPPADFEIYKMVHHRPLYKKLNCGQK